MVASDRTPCHTNSRSSADPACSKSVPVNTTSTGSMVTCGSCGSRVTVGSGVNVIGGVSRTLSAPANTQGSRTSTSDSMNTSTITMITLAVTFGTVFTLGMMIITVCALCVMLIVIKKRKDKEDKEMMSYRKRING